jgi:hypothetical protein
MHGVQTMGREVLVCSLAERQIKERIGKDRFI